jgi:hypothetical protein
MWCLKKGNIHLNIGCFLISLNVFEFKSGVNTKTSQPVSRHMMNVRKDY